MLNYLWAAMVIIGVVYGAFTGNLEVVGNGAVESGKDAVDLCLTMLGVGSMWCGLMKIAERAGIIRGLSKKMKPFINFMFPNIPESHKSRDYISENIIANISGLGWAATPAGLNAMRELSGLENDRMSQEGNVRKKQRMVASDEMCTFLVLNISSLQLIPVNIIAYRSMYGSVSPAGIIGPAIIATMVSTLVGILFCKIMIKSSAGTKIKR